MSISCNLFNYDGGSHVIYLIMMTQIVIVRLCLVGLSCIPLR